MQKIAIIQISEEGKHIARLLLSQVFSQGNEAEIISRTNVGKRWQDFDDFKQNFEVPQSLVDEVLAEGTKQKIEPKDDAELEKTLPYLRLQLKALIARDLWDMSEYFSVFNERSEIVKKALEVMGVI